MKIIRNKQFKIELNLIHCMNSNGFIPTEQDLQLLYDDLSQKQIDEFNNLLRAKPELRDIPSSDLVNNCRVIFNWSGECVSCLPINCQTLTKILDRAMGHEQVDKRILAAKMSKIASFSWQVGAMDYSEDSPRVSLEHPKLWFGATRCEPNALVKNGLKAVVNSILEETGDCSEDSIGDSVNKQAKFLAALQFADIPK
tara:strand:- start:99281 stop:99874 length:594 start_codon:yes stop_codon:yes gene_type:complete